MSTCRSRNARLRGLQITLSCCALAALAAAGAQPPSPDIAELSLEQLANVVVTSVSRREQSLGSAAASIYVISADDIRRSGATSIPDALRLAPNLQVARADANQYAISARGFNNVLANRMLVLVDGRIVYSPLFSGVFWEAQDIMLEDVERIEVISGPGATLWGANAVNGVINIITAPARDTQGPLVAAGGGNRESGAALRYGGTTGETHYRVYGKYVERGATHRADGTSVDDASERHQVGFRADWAHADNALTVQGDAYRADIDQVIGGSRNLGGANLLLRWNRRRDDGSTMQVLAYYDRVERDQPGAIQEDLDILHAEFQQGIVAARTHQLLWGGGYRYAHDALDNLTAGLAFIPATRDLHWYNAFVQDEWALTRSLALTLGLKAEHNDYSVIDWLPSARLAWSPAPNRLVWTALSRAARAPSRIDRELFSPARPPFALAGGPVFRSESSNVAELGYRAQATPTLSYSVTAFDEEHQHLRSLEGQPGGAVFENRMEGSTHGVEAWGTYRVSSAWRLDAGWVELRQNLRPQPGSTSTASAAGLGNDPKRWMTFRTAIDLTPRHELDVMVRHTGPLPNPAVPGYTAVDARLGWKVQKGIELSLTLQNLFDPGHPEFGAATNRAEFQRGAFFKVLWRP